MPAEEILKIDNLHLEVGGKMVLKGLNLALKKGERTILFGPNGAGKSSLLYAILGFPGYRVLSGRILFMGRDVTNLPVNDRVNLGLGVAFQNPPSIHGIKLREMLMICRRGISPTTLKKISKAMNMQEFLDRDVNLGFSGGEAKRAELLQILAQKPGFVMFDEPDSGVDLENVGLIGKQIDTYLRSHTGLVITHQGYILDFIRASRGCILYGGKIICTGSPKMILHAIRKKGYAGCAICKHRMKK
jgi:Fe-S cluster assembly ATP-binding protein